MELPGSWKQSNSRESQDLWRRPKRVLVSAQVVEALREGIHSGLWSDLLPGERVLMQTFRVGRNTVRRALKQLADDGFLKARHGVGYQLLRPGGKEYRASTRSVGVVLPVPYPMLRPSSAVWVDYLRAVLNDWGYALVLHSKPGFFGNRSEKMLSALVSRHRHECWILLGSTRAMQEWFQKSGIPCLLAGSSHSGIKMPSVDLDRRGLCRHAAGMLLSKGHRSLAFFHSSTGMAGDAEAAEGFLEAAGKPPVRNVRAEVVEHAPERDDINRKVRRLLAGSERPTGLLVSNPLHFLAVATSITRLGLRIPGDVSIISQDHEPYLDYFSPDPTCYILQTDAYSRSMAEILENILRHNPMIRNQVRLVPEFHQGATLTSPRR